MPKLKKKINYSILIKKTNKKKKQNSFKTQFSNSLSPLFSNSLFFRRTFNKQNLFSLYSQTLFLLTLHGWKVSVISKSHLH